MAGVKGLSIQRNKDPSHQARRRFLLTHGAEAYARALADGTFPSRNVRSLPCERCQGKGSIDGGEVCPVCEGEG